MNEQTLNGDQLAATLIDGAQLCATPLYLTLGECHLQVRANSIDLIERLRHYFAAVVGPETEADIEVIAIERGTPELGVTYRDWRREAGKSGRKDSYFDVPGARLVYKVRTGMVFLQSLDKHIAAGPCLQNDNQVINFINVQYMNWLQQRGWLICHAAGVTHDGRALAMAAFSGGGKSTLMLHLLDDPAINYLTNDRLFIKSTDGVVHAAGIPKLPRINPGTIVHNPRLQPLIAADERARLLALPRHELWELEDKYDVLIDEVYGPGRITTTATPLSGFLVLNWRHDNPSPAQLHQVDISQRRDLLKAIMKAPGPFYQYADGRFYQDDTPLDEAAYLAALKDVPVYEASGGVDFGAMVERLETLMA